MRCESNLTCGMRRRYRNLSLEVCHLTKVTQALAVLATGVPCTITFCATTYLVILGPRASSTEVTGLAKRWAVLSSDGGGHGVAARVPPAPKLGPGRGHGTSNAARFCPFMRGWWRQRLQFHTTRRLDAQSSHL